MPSPPWSHEIPEEAARLAHEYRNTPRRVQTSRYVHRIYPGWRRVRDVMRTRGYHFSEAKWQEAVEAIERLPTNDLHAHRSRLLSALRADTGNPQAKLEDFHAAEREKIRQHAGKPRE